MTLDGVSLLLLEDDQDTRELFARSLTKAGAEVRTADTAERALEILESWRPTAVICDLHLPDVDGYGFLQRVRGREQLAGGMPVRNRDSLQDRRRILREVRLP